MAYIERHIDEKLLQWGENPRHKPLLLRGARMVGKTEAVRNLGSRFDHFIEVNFVDRPELKNLFVNNHDVRQIAADLGKIFNTPVVPGMTLLFLDEIQECDAALVSLWFFKERFPELHVVASGNGLEDALGRTGSYGPRRILELYMYPLSFEEFLRAIGKTEWADAMAEATAEQPVNIVLHEQLLRLLRVFMIVGGMPASVRAWVETMDYSASTHELDGILGAFDDHFMKHDGKVDARLLRRTLDAVVAQTGGKFVYSRVEGGYRPAEVRRALGVLTEAGLVRPVRYTAAEGLPVGASSSDKFVKYYLLDTGLLLRMLERRGGGAPDMATALLTAPADADLLGMGGLVEMMVGWEMVKGSNPGSPHELYYWENLERGRTARVQFVTTRAMKILPMEVKAGVATKMKSLRLFLEKRGLTEGVRVTFDNFGTLTYKSGGGSLMIHLIPVYAIGRI